MTTTTPADERKITSYAFLAFVDAAKTLGIDREAYAAASPAVRALLDNPSLATTLVPGPILNDYIRAVAAAKGRAAVREMSLRAMRGPLGQLLGRLIESTLKLYGRGVEAVFSNMSTFGAPIMRGFSVEFEKLEGSAGVLHVKLQGKADPLAFAVWEGAAEYFFEVAQTRGTVGEAQIVGDEARIPLRW